MATHTISHSRMAGIRVARVAFLLLLALPLPDSGRAQGTLSALQTDVDQIAKRARPAVVTVLAQRVSRSADGKGRLQSHVGSGVAVEINLIVTTASVVLGADRVIIKTANGLQAQGMVVGADPISNIALVRVPNLRLPVVKLSQHPLDVGDWVVSLGTSYGAQPTQSVGNVAYRHREPTYSLLQLTNTVYPGNSGAAALNPDGELVGIVQGELGAPELSADGAGERRPGLASFVLPVESLRTVMDSIRRTGRVRHGFLGVTTRAIAVASVQPGGAPTPIGALVEGIVPGSPADRIGLRHGDLIVAYQGERVEYPEQLARWVAGTTPGQRVEIVWAREEVAMNGAAPIGASPDANPAWLATWRDEDGAPSAAKISEIQREIRRLNGELNKIKGQGTQPKR
jgi:serine protease Do